MTTQLPWYHEGLPFKCTGCGGCCTGFSGFVWVSDKEIAAMAEHKKMSIHQFEKNYLVEVEDGRKSLREMPGSFDCVFLEGQKRCGLYDVRPTQCRTFPFWPQNIATPEAWKETARHCEGINDNAPLINLSTIEKNANP